MQRVEMQDYTIARARFRWQLPATFNFGADVVDRYAEDPQRPALIWCDETGRERRFSFADVRDASNRLANLLHAMGIGRGDRVIVLLPRIPEWQIVMVACLKLGAVPIPCVEMLTAKDIAYRVRHAGARAAITTPANTGKFAGHDLIRLAVGAAPGWTDVIAAARDLPARFEAARLAPDDPAVIYYTSGSTGEPKGVTHGARSLFAWRVSAWYWLDLRDGDLMWCTSDTGWSKAGTSILFGPWSCGAAVLFYHGGFDPGQRLALLSRYRVTVFCAAATELRRLLAEDVRAHDLSALRLTVSAGESVNPAVVTRWREATGTPLLDGYGQTETLMTVLNYPCMPVKPGSMGKPLPGTDVVVLDEAHRVAPPDTPGRLAVRLPNPQLMLGYWNDAARSAATRVRAGAHEYFLTGDRARIDADGYVFYLGRDDDIINSAGYRIGPMEVENALMEHPAVQECAAVASPDAERGEVVKAFIVLRAGFAPSAALARALQEHARRVTAPYKYPRRIEFIDELPKTATGKIRRAVLKQRERAAPG